MKVNARQQILVWFRSFWNSSQTHTKTLCYISDRWELMKQIYCNFSSASSSCWSFCFNIVSVNIRPTKIMFDIYIGSLPLMFWTVAHLSIPSWCFVMPESSSHPPARNPPGLHQTEEASVGDTWAESGEVNVKGQVEYRHGGCVIHCTFWTGEGEAELKCSDK